MVGWRGKYNYLFCDMAKNVVGVGDLINYWRNVVSVSFVGVGVAKMLTAMAIMMTIGMRTRSTGRGPKDRTTLAEAGPGTKQ